MWILQMCVLLWGMPVPHSWASVEGQVCTLASCTGMYGHATRVSDVRCVVCCYQKYLLDRCCMYSIVLNRFLSGEVKVRGSEGG